MKKRILSILLSFVMVLGMMPTVAFAGDTGTTEVKSIMLGTSGLKNPTKEGITTGYYTPNSYVCFDNNGGSILWRVLDADKDNTSDPNGIFLLSENVIDGEMLFDSSGDSNAYQRSYAKTWCNTFANTFSSVAKDAMRGVTKNDETKNVYGITWGSSSLTTDDKLFFLSAEELDNYVGKYTLNNELLFNTGTPGWWLRSPYTYNAGSSSHNTSCSVGIVSAASAGLTYRSANTTGVYARPAMNLNKDAILFTSAAVGGKPESTKFGSLTEVVKYTDKNWKLTLKDSTRNGFSVSEKSVTGTAGSTVTLNYTGATVGDDNYVSVILEDSSKNDLYYGKLLETDYSSDGLDKGTVRITIPEELTGSTYTLHVFSEKCNGDYKTDYASAFCDVQLTLAEARIGTTANGETTYKTYTTLAEALSAAGGNDAEDTIEIISKKLTLTDTDNAGTLKKGDSIKTYGGVNNRDEIVFNGEIKAETGNVTLGLYEFYEANQDDNAYKTGESTVKFTSGPVKIVTGTAILCGGVTATGKSEVDIINMSEGTDDSKVIYVVAGGYSDGYDEDSGEACDLVVAMKGGKVQIGETEYEEASATDDDSDKDYYGGMQIMVTKDGTPSVVSCTLFYGAVKLDNNESINVGYYTNTAVTNTGDGAITVDAGNGCSGSTVTVPAGGKFEIDRSEYAASENGATFLIGRDDDGVCVALTDGKATTDGNLIAVFDEDNVGMMRFKGFTKTAESDAAYTVDITAKTLAVPANTTVTGGDGVQYTGEGTFTFGENGKIIVPDGAALTDGNNRTINGVNSAPATEVTLTNGAAKLTGGKGSSNSDMIATITNIGDKKFIAENAQKYTVDTAGKLITDAAGSVTMDHTKFTGAAGDVFTLGTSDDNTTATIPADATISDETGNTIKGVAGDEQENAQDTKVEIDKTSGALALIAGKGSVTGKAGTGSTVKAKFTVDGVVWNVEVAVPAGTTATIDLDDTPPAVKNLGKGKSVTYGGVTYTAVDKDSTFPLNSSKLTKVGEKAVVLSNKTEYVTVEIKDGPNVTVPGSNSGDVTIEKTSTGGEVTIAEEHGTFVVNEKTYTAGSDNAKFAVDVDRNVALVSGSARIGDGVSIIGESGKIIENPSTTGGDEITVAADKNKDTVTVPSGTGNKVKIGDTTYNNGSADKNMVIEVTGGNNELTSGAVELDKGEKIKVGGKEIENTGDKTITVKANDPEDKNSVVVPAGGRVKIGGTEYEVVEAATIVIDENVDELLSGSVALDDAESIIGSSGETIINPADSESDQITVAADNSKDTITVPKSGSVKVGNTTYTNSSDSADMIIEVTAGGNKLTAGSVELDKNEVINVGNTNTEVANTGNETITVSATANDGGTVAVPAGGTLNIGEAKITDVKQETTFTVDSNGEVTVALKNGETVTVNGATYTGAGDGGTLAIDPATGKVIGVTGVINIKIDENRLTEGFSYELVPGQSVTIGKYVYAAPKPGELGDVTIKGRGTDEDEKVLNPAVVLKNVNGTVEIALSADKEKNITYTAANANTVFAMAADDKDTTKVDLLDNVTTPNSALKFTDADKHTVNGVTYQAQEIKESGIVQAIEYTVTFGEASVDSGKKDDKGEAIVETVNRNLVSVEEGSKVIAKMTAKGTINKESGKIGDEPAFTGEMPFTATNSNASILIDSTESPSKISGSGSYLTEIKNDDGNVTGYKVTRYSGSTTTNSVVNKTEDKTAGTTATTTATVKNTTTTKADGTKTTTATIDDTTATKIVEKAVENKSKEVVVNTATSVTETAAGSTTEIQLPEQTVQGLSQKTEASVTIKSDSAEVTLDKAAVDGLASQAGNDGYVKLVVETVKQEAKLLQVDLKLVTSKGNVTDFKGGNVSVTVKLNTSLAAKPVVCVYIDDFGTYHKVKGEKKANGTYTFETSHFSTYAVMAEEDANKVIAEQTANVKKLVSALSLKARSAKTAKGNIKVTLTADKDAIKAIEDLGYTVKYKFYRSTKKASSYAAKIEGKGKTYTNTTGKKGTRYYYKARVMVYDAQGALIAKSALKQCKYACRTK